MVEEEDEYQEEGGRARATNTRKTVCCCNLCVAFQSFQNIISNIMNSHALHLQFCFFELSGESLNGACRALTT
jgi:hypothetical protein